MTPDASFAASLLAFTLLFGLVSGIVGFIIGGRRERGPTKTIEIYTPKHEHDIPGWEDAPT